MAPNVHKSSLKTKKSQPIPVPSGQTPSLRLTQQERALTRPPLTLPQAETAASPVIPSAPPQPSTSRKTRSSVRLKTRK